MDNPQHKEEYTLVLTKEEYEIILTMREQDTKKRQMLINLALEVSWKYRRWLIETGVESSYDSFLEFVPTYAPTHLIWGLDDRSGFYELLTQLILKAENFYT